MLLGNREEPAFSRPSVGGWRRPVPGQHCGLRTFCWASVPLQSSGTLLYPANLCVLCPQASATGEGTSGAGIVCGAAAPSSALSQLSFLSSLSRFSPRQLLVLFSFAAFSSAGSCFRLTQAVCFAEQGAPQLVSALPGFVPPLRLPAFKKNPLCVYPCMVGLHWLGQWTVLGTPQKIPSTIMQRQDGASPTVPLP